MDRSLLQLALREVRGVYASRVALVALAAAIVVLAVSGPFGTFELLNIGERLFYWAVMVVLTYGVGRTVSAVLLELLKRPIGETWPRAIVAALLAALPVTGVIVAINAVAYRGFDWNDVLPAWLYATLPTLVIVVGLVWFGDRLRAAAPAATAPALPAILERVPLPQRGKLLALVVEDHYVDIVTDRGKTLVLMRLADAMREADGVAGLQIHRSHWVARDAVVAARRSEGKLLLELSNGLRLPVSRGFAAAVREAGLV